MPVSGHVCDISIPDSFIYIPAKVMYQALSRCVTETYQVLFVDVIDRSISLFILVQTIWNVS